MSATCEEKEAKDFTDDTNASHVDMKANSESNNEIGMKSACGSSEKALDSTSTNAEEVGTTEKQVEQSIHGSSHNSELQKELINSETEKESCPKVTNPDSILIIESVEQETIDKITEKEITNEIDTISYDKKKDTTVANTGIVIKKEPVETEMAGDVTENPEKTGKDESLSDIVIKVEPIDIDDQPIMSRDGVEILKTENLMSYRQIKTEKDDHDSGTENDSGDESSVIFSDAPVVASDEESENISKAFIPKEVPRTKGEMLPEDLPPLDELKINIAKDEKLLMIGQVSGIVNTLVVIQSLPDTPALNEESVFFNEDRKVFGQVFEIFGPVAKPFYSIRFNNIEDIKSRNINIGDKVYCAPNLEDITQYIFLDQLKQIKGSDASWKDNNEPPERCLDYSDDESERRSKSKRKGDKAIKEEDEESYLDALPGATGQRSSKPQRRRRQKKPQNDRDCPVPESGPSTTNNNTNIWNCWPPRGPSPRSAPPSNQNHFNQNFRQPPPSAPWHQPSQGQRVHPWQQSSMNQRQFNPQHNFHYQNLPHMNQMPFGQGMQNHGNPNLFMSNVPNTGFTSGQNNRFSYSQSQNNVCSGPNQNHSFQSASNVQNARFVNRNGGYLQNNSASQIMDTRFIQNNQPADTPIHNPYHTGVPK